jgi:Domain of unknown function (DUF4149)
VRTLLRLVCLLLLGLWLGAAIFFGAAVAPNLFRVLRGADLANANELAGSIVTRLLAVINHGGFEVGLFVLVVRFFATCDQRLLIRLVEMLSLTILVIMTGIGQWVISAKMVALRAAMHVPIDQVVGNDPRRVAFDSLHRYSVEAMGIALIAALVAFIMIAVDRGTSRTLNNR